MSCASEICITHEHRAEILMSRADVECSRVNLSYVRLKKALTIIFQYCIVGISQSHRHATT